MPCVGPLLALPLAAGQSQPPGGATKYDKNIFQKPIPADELTFLNQFAGAPSNELFRDKRFGKLWRAAIPDCVFHYGRDMPLWEALEMALRGSGVPVRIRADRYLMVSGLRGPYLSGRGFLWIDLQDGIVLGGFYFHPTNGEPTPAVNIFSRQVKEEFLSMSQLPPAFAEDVWGWSAEFRVPPITTRYFINGANRKILLEHDEDYCAAPGPTMPGAPAPPQSACKQMNAYAADLDLDAAYYLDHTHHKTNATASMLSGRDQVLWAQFRDNTCGIGPDPLGCRVLTTRERTRVIIRRIPSGRANRFPR